MSLESLQSFRHEVRAFLAEHLSADLRERAVARDRIEKADYVAWQQLLDDQGWFAGRWPVEYGGAGWSRLQRWIFEQELDLAGAPWLMPFGVTFVAPVLYTFGSVEQQRQFLPPIKRSTHWWAQGYSEPGAGSDLANLKTRAERQGDHYVVNGQKLWTSYAQWADYMFTLVRTSADGPIQRGVSFLLIDMNQPGITVRPIPSIDGEHHLNEVFLDDVHVPAENLVGEENRGWTYAKFLLVNERFLNAEVGKARRMIRQLADLVDHLPQGPKQHRWRSRICELYVEAFALEAAAVDMLSAIDDGAAISAEPSILKIMGPDLLQRIAGLMLDLLEGTGLSIEHVPAVIDPTSAGELREYLYGRAGTIYGGSSEIQRNILSQSLGL